MKEIDCNHDIRRLKKFYAFDILSQINHHQLFIIQIENYFSPEAPLTNDFQN